MNEARIDFELERLHKTLPFLWEDYGFRVRYFTRDYGMYDQGFVIGLENDICKLVFEKETNSREGVIRDHVGTKSAMFTPPDFSYFATHEWYSLKDLIYWLGGIEYESVEDVDKDLKNLSEYLKLYIDKVLALFEHPSEFDQKLEYYRNAHKIDLITVETMSEERVRLQLLGKDWSLEAVIASLRGGKK